jgi:hypothetical protein
MVYNGSEERGFGPGNGDKMLLLDTKDLVLLGRMNKVWSHLSESSTGQSMLLWGLSPNPFLFRYTPALSLVFLL